MLDNKEIFTIPEVNLMCIFDDNRRENLISKIAAAVLNFSDEELIDIANSTIAKLGKMSDNDFTALTLYPEWGDYDDEQEAQNDG
jgi:hypothetical protein